MRYHLDRDTFQPERAVMAALNDGHVPFHIGAAKYGKGNGEKQERIEYSINRNPGNGAYMLQKIKLT